MVDAASVTLLIAVVVFVLLILLLRSARSIQPYQQGVVTLFGSYKRLINPGLNFINPVAAVVRMDLRTQVLEVPRQEVITKDNSPTNVDAIIYIKVVDAPKAIFQVQDYHVATVALAQTTLRSIIGDMELDEVLYNRERINTRLRDILDEATDRWGVRVEAVEIKEVDPVGPVKAAMEEQTSAERQRRAAVLRADGEKRSAILVAEGQKRSRILQAEGLRQSKILEAEGGRMATILEAQGESQRLRILSLGAGTLDAKALTVLSLDTVSNLGAGQATKILFPFEFSRLMEGASEYLGTSRSVPDRSLNTLDELENRIGKIDDILGPIPRQDELLTEIKSIEDEIKAETDESTAMVGGSIDDGAAPHPGVSTPPARLGPPEVMDMGSFANRAAPAPAAASSQANPPPPPDPKKRPPPP
ncbi:MAG TPA: SPFH domain-containing protein [Thermoplasmata archaeon]|jgi:regulator of protease activity HflC (stomatin/prohibitin superfamily)|nr:SPFH domain-containing protein [Thermoplasmata archaeon]